MAEFSSLDTNQQNIPFSGVNTNPAALNLTNPDSILSGTNRGSQRINNTDGSYMIIGQQPSNNGFGIGFYDNTGYLISKTIGATQYIYDKANSKNIMQVGKLPDGTYGIVVAKQGYNVSELFT